MNNETKQLSAVSLFSCGGIGDLALRAAGINTIVSNELIEERHQIFKENFPDTICISGDIWQESENIVNTTNTHLAGPLDFVFATPPCQGMSKNGRGKLLNSVRAGLKPDIDERNLLIIPTLDIITRLQPETVLFENVPEMLNTEIPLNNNLIGIVEFIKERLGASYHGKAEVVEFADYGVPQRRQRLITIFSKNKQMTAHFSKYGTFLPPKTHSPNGLNETEPWITLRDAISHLPPLDAAKNQSAQDPNIPLHKVPILDKDKYFWVSNTPPEKGAFDNQCVKCGFTGNRSHGSTIGSDGINRSHTDTPLNCGKCGALLPRPWVKNGSEYRIMKGFTSAYKRMSWNLPASALTRNLSYACSDNKLHPAQHRVLSLHEATILHTITDFNYKWERPDKKKVSDKLVRELIGESIPPRGLLKIVQFLVDIMSGCNQNKVHYTAVDKHYQRSLQLSLF